MDLHIILVTLHAIGFAFGVGGATSSDLVFLRSIKNGSVSRDEYNLIKTLSTVVWTSVALLVVSGVALMALQQYEIGEVPRYQWSWFQLKVLAFFFIVVNGLVFHFGVFPVVRRSIGKSFRSNKMKRRYPLFAITGAVSIVSWYGAFLLVAFGRILIDYSFFTLLAGYIAAICFGAVGAYSVIKLYGDGKSDVVDTGKKFIIQSALLLALFIFLAAIYILVAA
jgi:hypothetical protein